jgi:hypothetical protein
MRTRVGLAALALLSCDGRTLDAVTGASCLEQPEQAACALPSWPNEYSRANSDAWLPAHHDALRVIKPRVLVLDFHNDLSVAQVRQVAQRQIDALADSSRYHGYKAADAEAFLQYELLDVIDLTDRPPPSSWAFSSSTKVPLNAEGTFDLAALFSPRFDALYQQRDQEQQPLGLCALFERGVINELWLAVGDPAREPASMVECKARYGADNRRRDGRLQGTSHSDECARFPVCGASVRIAHLSPLRGLGCDLLVRGWAIRGSLRNIPYLAANAQAFMDECGDPEFPPNATEKWDFENRTVVQARCAHYGLRDAADASDLREPYSFATLAALAARYPADCGGPWQVYWRQNMPGLDNRATDADGKPMKNWWPFLFY